MLILFGMTTLAFGLASQAQAKNLLKSLNKQEIQHATHDLHDERHIHYIKATSASKEGFVLSVALSFIGLEGMYLSEK